MKTLTLTLSILLLIATPALAQEIQHQKELLFGWEQQTADLPHLGGWGLYVRPTAEGAHEKVIDLPYAGSGVGPAGEVQKTAELTVTGAPGSTVRKYFVVDAYNKEGKRSGFSNEVFFDFVIPVAEVTTPVKLNVKIIQ